MLEKFAQGVIALPMFFLSMLSSGATTSNTVESSALWEQAAPVQDNTNALRSALAQKLDELGRCQTDLGPLTRLQASVVNGDLVDVKTARLRFVAEFEKANAGKTLDEKNVVTEKK
jgi:hypothetical protein